MVMGEAYAMYCDLALSEHELLGPSIGRAAAGTGRLLGQNSQAGALRSVDIR